jgi:putative membrane protein
MSSISIFLKGMAMGAANVIPGVSGGTIALITGIYERLINAIKSADLTALRHLLKGEWRVFWTITDGSFLLALFAGIGFSIITLAKLLEFLLQKHETLTMAFFFGLILVSIYFVGKTVRQWSVSTVAALLIGIVVAVGIALLAPASENSAFGYVFLCGIVAMCSMILPGLSGSFVLIIMGNYALILAAIGSANLSVLIPLALGCAFGLVAFSHLLALIFKHFHDQTIALMTGFIAGSLAIIWPWKETLVAMIEREGKAAKEVVTGYNWYMPPLDTNTLLALALIVAGMAALYLIEKFAGTADAG